VYAVSPGDRFPPWVMSRFHDHNGVARRRSRSLALDAPNRQNIDARCYLGHAVITTVRSEDGRLTTHRVEGGTGVSEIQEALDRYRANRTPDILWDFSRADPNWIPSTPEVQYLVAAIRDGDRSPEDRTAFVVRTKLGYGMARMAQAFSESGGLPHEIQVFYDVEGALDWLAATTR
jgi:hypothetical protein